MTTTNTPTHSIAVTIELNITEEFLSDILVGAFDGAYGACWYWAQPRSKDGAHPFKVDGDLWRSVTIIEKESSGEKYKSGVVDYERLLRGIKKLFEPGVLPKRSDVRNAILQNDGGQLDAEGFDIIVQLAFFGELVYG